MEVVQFYKEKIEVQNNDLSFLKVGDIIWAKRYKNNYERSKIEKGHQESPFVVIKIENGKVYCLQCTSNPHQEVKWNILYYPLGRLNYETRKTSYINCLTVYELKEIQFVELIGHLSDYDLNQLKKQLYILKNSKFKIKPKIERKYLDFKIGVGDMIEYENKWYYIDSLNDKEFEVYQVSKKIKKDRSILINNTYYNFLFQSLEKINIHSFYNLVDTFNTGEIELINKYRENFHINGDSKEDLKIGSLIEYKENSYYVYDEKNNDQLVYHVYNNLEKGMADILIDGYIYHTYFEQEIILKEKLIKYGYNIKAYASSDEIEYNQKVFNLPKSNRVLERKNLTNELLSSKRGTNDFIPMVILKNTNNQNYYLIVGREDNVVELVNINDFMDVFYFELDDNSPFEYYRILQKEEYEKYLNKINELKEIVSSFDKYKEKKRMETKVLINYDMQRLLSRVAKEYGRIKRGEEENYNPQLRYIEHQIYEAYKQIPISDYELQDAILMAIYDLKGYVDNIKYDYTNIRDKKVIKYTKELEMIFNPFINKDIKITQEAKKDLKGLFTLPIICLARIYDSVDFWRGMYGKNGYFQMIEEYVIPLYKLSKFKYALPFNYLDDEIINKYI